MRSNDFIWGASAVNIFNYTLMQEYFASILNLEVGTYYHIANNFHYYEGKHQKLVEMLSECNDVIDESFKYDVSFKNLAEFDDLIKALGEWEQGMRENKSSDLIDFSDDFLNDWAKVLYLKITHNAVEFTNPILNRLAHQYLKTKKK
jgi:thymidylate synthase